MTILDAKTGGLSLAMRLRLCGSSSLPTANYCIGGQAVATIQERFSILGTV